jgi:hypothetical protein
MGEGRHGQGRQWTISYAKYLVFAAILCDSRGMTMVRLALGMPECQMRPYLCSK